MVPDVLLLDLIAKVQDVEARRVPGDLVECGVWRGGAAFLMAEVLAQLGNTDRKVWLFDSFEGLPPPEDIDGPGAHAWARDTGGAMYHDNCRAGLEEVQANAEALGLTERLTMVPGWFEDSLPANREAVGPIALLRIDCDWYEPVKSCLETLYDSVSPHGIVILDDYYTWDGCAIATHEFLADRKLPHRIEATSRMAAWFQKS
jgi:hypothetical protein